MSTGHLLTDRNPPRPTSRCIILIDNMKRALSDSYSRTRYQVNSHFPCKRIFKSDSGPRKRVTSLVLGYCKHRILDSVTRLMNLLGCKRKRVHPSPTTSSCNVRFPLPRPHTTSWVHSIAPWAASIRKNKSPLVS